LVSDSFIAFATRVAFAIVISFRFIPPLLVMIKFESAQPALLYLVPACLGSSLLTAVVRGELKELFAYSEEVEEEEEEKAAATDKKND